MELGEKRVVSPALLAICSNIIGDCGRKQMIKIRQELAAFLCYLLDALPCNHATSRGTAHSRLSRLSHSLFLRPNDKKARTNQTCCVCNLFAISLAFFPYICQEFDILYNS
jgi:hypothetical protein